MIFTDIVGIIVDDTVAAVPITVTSNLYVPLLVTTKEFPDTIILLALELAIILPGCKLPPEAVHVCAILFFI